MYQVLHTFIVALILIEDLIFFSFAWNYGVAHGHILRAASRTSERRTASKVVSRFYPNIASSKWRTRTSRNACSSWSRTSLSLVLWYFSKLPHHGDLAASRPRFWWWIQDRLWRLLRNWRYFYLCMVFSSRCWYYRWLRGLIRRLPPNSKADYLVRTI